jgi:8-oxo-dGTP pyrophosphatase MutT (NUDIX family)
MTEPPPRRPGIRLPPQFAERAREVLEGTVPPVTPRDAATVMLLRPGHGAATGGAAASGAATSGAAKSAPADGPGLQVYMLRRRSSMAFAAGAYVFPGGSVDASDDDAGIAWAGPDAAEWGRRLDTPAGLARTLVCAAVRETFEESGVLLAGPDGATVLATTEDEGWEDDRRALLAGSLSLAGLLRRRGLVLRSDLLRPWARWITPVTEARRYDTRFFAAALPAGQIARDVSGEADETAWLEPGAALQAASRGEIALFPPTAVTLGELRACGTVPAALGARRRMTALIPQVMLAEGAAWLTVPDGVEYPL